MSTKRFRPDASNILSAEKKQKGLIILLCWYGSKDPYVILLPGHILYRKPGGHKIVYTGVKFKSSFNVVKTIPTDSACYNDSEKKYSLTYLQRTVS